MGGLTNVAAAMGLSRQTLYAALKDPEQVSEKTLRKLASVELSNLSRSDVVEEEQAPYDIAPKRAEIEARVKAFLDAAERVPGGLGYALVQVQLHLDPARLAGLVPSRGAVRALEEYLRSQRREAPQSKAQ